MNFVHYWFHVPTPAERFWYALLIVFVGLVSYGLGYLCAKHDNREETER